MKDDHFLAKNFGFTEHFINSLETIYVLKKSAFRKINSENAVERIPREDAFIKRCNEAEDKELYQEDEAEYIPEEQHPNTNVMMDCISNCYDEEDDDANQAKTLACSTEQMRHLNQLLQEMNSSNENKHVIKAYQSKHKSKYYKIYQMNSEDNKEKNKYRFFHKCNYPHCGRTFASSGWLKSHFAEHMKAIADNKFNVLFEKYIRKKGISVGEM